MNRDFFKKYEINDLADTKVEGNLSELLKCKTSNTFKFVNLESIKYAPITLGDDWTDNKDNYHYPTVIGFIYDYSVEKNKWYGLLFYSPFHYEFSITKKNKNELNLASVEMELKG